MTNHLKELTIFGASLARLTWQN